MTVDNNIIYTTSGSYPLMTEELDDPLPEGSKDDLQTIGEEILNTQRHKRRITKKQFSLMHGDSFIAETNLEGGHACRTLKYWQKLLSSWLDGHAFFEDILAAEEIRAILADIEDAILAYDLFKQGKRNELLSFISKTLLDHGRCVVPLRYQNGSGGHVFTAVFELDGDNMVCQLLNRGDGMECHPVVEVREDKIIRSYCSDQFIIPFKHFNEKTRAGKTFWDQLILYNTTYPAEETKDYCAKEMYAYFYVLADRVIPIKEESALGATAQKAGTCAEKVPELLIRQYLQRNYSNKQAYKLRKRVLFAARFDSLLDAYYDLDLKEDVQNYYILEHALRTFGKFVADLQESGLITDQEVRYATALGKQVHRKLKEHQQFHNTSLEVPALPQNVLDWFKGEVAPLIRCNESAVDPLDLPPLLPTIPEDFKPEMFLKNLEIWVEFAKKEYRYDPQRAFNFAYRAIQSLPIPTHQKDCWNDVPKKDISESLKYLEELTVICLQYIQFEGVRSSEGGKNALALYDILTTLSGFSIAHKLCFRLKRLKLKGFGVHCQFAHHFNENPAFFYSLGENTKRYLAIQRYFEGLNNENGEIFHIPHFVPEKDSDKINLKHQLDCFKKHYQATVRKILVLYRENENREELKKLHRDFLFYEHIKYLLQFTRSHEDAVDLAQLWAKGMAPEYYILEHFAGLSYFQRSFPIKRHNILISGDKNIFFSWEGKHHFTSFKQEYELSSSPAVEPTSYIRSLTSDAFDSKHDENKISIFSDEGLTGAWQNLSDSQQFLKIAYTENSLIKISSLVNWMSAHIKRLNQKEIQDEVLSLLLKPPHLEIAVKAEPYLVDQLRSTFKEAIEYYLSKNYGYKTALFLLRAAYLMETQFLEMGDIENCEKNINSLRKTAKAIVKDNKKPETIHYESILTQIYLYKHRKILSDTDCINIISACLEIPFAKCSADKAESKMLIRLEYEIKLLLSQHEETLVEKMKDQAFVNRSFKKINDRFHFPRDAEWEGEYPLFRYQNVSLDISNLEILVGNGNLITSWPRIIQANDDDGHFLNLLQEYTPLKDNVPLYYDAKQKSFWSEDRSIHIFLHQFKVRKKKRKRSEWVLERAFVINGKRRWYQLSKPPKDDAHFLDDGKLPYQVWQACDDSNTGLLHDGRTNEFFATFENDQDQYFTFYRLDQKGNETGEILANIEDCDQEGDGNKLYHSLQLLGYNKQDLSGCHLWMKEGKYSSIVLANLGFEFTYNEKRDRFEAASLPGYYLKQLGFYTFLNLKTALVLQNAKGEKKILLPLWDFNLKGHKSSSEVKKVSYALDIKRSKARYCVFDVDEKQERLISRDPYANLYLVTFLAASGDFENAMRYLDKLNPLQFYAQSADDLGNYIGAFVKEIASTNPLCSAFVLRLALHYIHNQNLRLASRYQSRRPKQIELPWEEILEHAIFILRKNILKEEGHLPYYLPLDIFNIQAIYNFCDTFSKQDPVKHLKVRICIAKLNSLISNYLKPSSPNRTNWGEINWEDQVDSLLSKQQTLVLTSTSIKRESLHLSKKDFSKKFLSLYHLFLREKNYQVAKMRFIPLLFSFQFESEDEHLLLVALLHTVMEYPQEFRKIRDESVLLEDILPGVELSTSFSLFEDKVPNTPLKSLEGTMPQEKKALEEEPCSATKVDQTIFFPLGKTAEDKFIEQSAKYQTETPFALESPTLEPSTKLEEEIFNDLSRGHRMNQDKDVYFYELQEDQTLDALNEDLKNHIRDDRKKALTLKKKIEKAANKYINKQENLLAQDLAYADRHRLRKYWHQRAKMDFARHIFPAFLLQDASLLKKHNPFLTDDEIGNIFNDITNYMLIVSRIDQAKEAYQKIKNGETVQAIGTVIHKKRLYDPLEYPELLIYEYASGFLLRENQVELLKWILKEEDPNKRKELLVEFQAGGGKTKVISAILIFLAYKKGKFPVFYSLPALHDITKDDLRGALSSIFNLKLAVLEFRLTTKLSTDELKGILEDLRRWKADGYALQVTPEIYHALYLNYQFALRSKDIERVETTGKIRKFFLENGYFIIDEAHRNTTALWQANMTTGPAIHLTQEEQDLFVMCYKALTGNISETLKDENGREIHELLEISSNQQAKLLPEDLPKVLRALAQWICQYYGIESDNEIVDYLTIKTEPMPEVILSMEDAEIANLLFLARGMLTEILPITLSLVGSFDHGGSIRETDDIESPRYGKAPSSSQYETAEIAAALCNQGLYQRGVNASQMARLFEKIVQRHESGDVEAQILFERWTQGETLPFNLDEIDVRDRSQMSLLATKIGKNPDVIEYFLRSHLLPQIKTYAIKLTSTAPNLVDGGLNTILVSATIGRKEEYPKIDDQYEALPFQAAVIQRALSDERNQTLHWVKTQSPKQLFAHLYETDKTVFENLEGMIDVGGVNIQYTTEEMAEQFLDFAKEEHLGYFGALYIQEETGAANNQQQLILIKQKTRERIVLQGSNLYQALRNAGIKHPEKRKFFKVYGPTQCTGTDLKLTPNAKMLVLFSESTSLWGLIQALMRMRGFIDPLDPTKPNQPTQSCVLVGPKKLEQKMPIDEEGAITPKSVFMYALSKEASSTEERIIARAFQQIAHEYRRFVDQKMMQAETPEEQIALYEKHVNAFEEAYERNLQALFGNPLTDQDTDIVLENFSEKFREGAAISEEDWIENERGVQLINQVIEETTALVPQVHQKKNLTNMSTNTNIGEQRTEGVGEQEDENQARMLNKNLNYADLESCPLQDYAKKDFSIASPRLTLSGETANDKFETTFFSNELYILPDTYQTVEEREIFLKNFEYLLIIFEGEKRYVYVTSRHDAEIYQEQLLNTQEGDGCPDREVALFTSQGLLAQNGQGKLAMDQMKIKAIRKSLWLRKICTDVALLNGKIYDFSFFEKQMSLWVEEDELETFMDFFNALLGLQGTPEEADIAAVEYCHNQAILGKTQSFTNEELELILHPEFTVMEEEQTIESSFSEEDYSSSEESYHSSELILSEEIYSSEEEESEGNYSLSDQEKVSEESSWISEDEIVSTSSSSSEDKESEESNNFVNTSIEDRHGSSEREVIIGQQSSSSALEEAAHSSQRIVKVLPMIGGVMIITALVLALITGGWGAAAYLAPIHIASFWIYVSLGSGGGFSLLLFSGGGSLTLSGFCLRKNQQEIGV